MPSLSITYLNSQAKVGDRVFIGVVADSEGQAIDGVDVMLTFSSHLQPITYMPTQLLPVKNFVDKTNPFVLNFSQLCNPTEPIAVKGLIAVIECKAVSAGSAPIKFKYTVGSTIDTNMASNGIDILTGVTNKTITVK